MRSNKLTIGMMVAGVALIRGGNVGVVLGQPPTLSWSRTYTGSGVAEGAGVAADANPNPGALQSFPAQAQLHHTNDTVGRIIHGPYKGASTGTGLAMPAFVNFHAGPANDFAGKTGVQLT